MAQKYNVYATGVDYDKDDDGEWVSAEEHEKEVTELEERITELQDELADANAQAINMEADRDLALAEVEQLKEELEELKKHADDVESVVHGFATYFMEINEELPPRNKYPLHGQWRGE